MFDFQASGQASGVRRRPVLPLAISIAIHAAVTILVLAFTFSAITIEQPRPARAIILLSPFAVIPAAPRMARRIDRTPLRQPRAPAIQFAALPFRETAHVPAPQIPLPEIPRPPMLPLEPVHLAAAPQLSAPPLRLDSLAPFATPEPNRKSATLRSSGFSQIAVEKPARSRPARLLTERFDDATLIAAVEPRSVSIVRALPVTRAVEILSKPRPAYTDDARRERIEGEVLLEILFAASADVRVLGIVRGLGHGLDENAITAAEAIRFRPAERAGVAADSTAIVHIVFQLAY